MFENFNFQRIVLLVAGILFVGFMITVVYSMIKANTIGEWPPVIANCPDNWVVGADGKTCENPNQVFKSGFDSKCEQINPTSETYSGANGLCQKHEWSKSCGVNWDGISNNPSVCTKAQS
jgi:hypothetical protein